MAGAGYKLYSTGDVLTASDVNTYIQQQTVMVFADASARTTALTGVVAEGMLTYLKDTDVVQYYSGSGWVTVNTDQTPLTTKGDLFTYSTQDTRLAVGNNGETLVADSSTSTGLRWQGNYAAGKNIVINGDFRINQRSFTSTTSNGVYGHDRWSLQTNSTCTYSTQAFTAGTAPVTGYEGINFARMVSTTNSSTSEYIILQYKAEDVRTLAAQTATVSFWAKAASGTPKVGVEISQVFGSGGSGAVNGTGQTVTLSTSWTRYSVTISVPSISGKTIGTNNYLELNFWCSAGSSFNGRSGTVGNQSATIDIWGVQVEAGSVATAFQTATGTLAGELAACQRYYYRVGGDQIYQRIGIGSWSSTTNLKVVVQNPVPMRVAPSTSLEYGTLTTFDGVNFYAVSAITAPGDASSKLTYGIDITTATSTQHRPGWLLTNGSTNGYFGLSAEL